MAGRDTGSLRPTPTGAAELWGIARDSGGPTQCPGEGGSSAGGAALLSRLGPTSWCWALEAASSITICLGLAGS